MPVRNLPLKALFLSLLVHIIALSAFMFTLPLSRTSFKPSFVFLGPILKDVDVGGVFVQSERGDEPLPLSQDSSENGAEVFFHPSENTARRFFEGPTRQPVTAGSAVSPEKIVTKSLFDMPQDMEHEQPGSVAEPIEPDPKIVPYKPLKLLSK